jgi:hypothetical protein
MGRTPAKQNVRQDQHHPWCSFSAQPRAGCQHCDLLNTAYPFKPDETAAEATARYFPQSVMEPTPEPKPGAELVMIKPGRPIFQATEEMIEAHVQVQEALDELEIYMRKHTVTLRRARKADEADRVNSARATQIKATRRSTSLVVLDTDGHRREVKRIKTTVSKMEKEGRIPKELAEHLYTFAHLVAAGMGCATEDFEDSTNRLTSPYDIVSTGGGFGSQTPKDIQLAGMSALQAMRQRMPKELLPVFDQMIDEEVSGFSPYRRTLAELGDLLGYKHKQASAAGGTLVFSVVCMIAHFMREYGFISAKTRAQYLKQIAPKTSGGALAISPSNLVL